MLNYKISDVRFKIISIPRNINFAFQFWRKLFFFFLYSDSTDSQMLKSES